SSAVACQLGDHGATRFHRRREWAWISFAGVDLTALLGVAQFLHHLGAGFCRYEAGVALIAFTAVDDCNWRGHFDCRHGRGGTSDSEEEGGDGDVRAVHDLFL